jgi:CO/xanthine dehydrogenase Mo-binding subunit
MSKITGQAVYTYDINPSHIGNFGPMVYMGMIKCPYPHAKFTIDASKAIEAGYVVVTQADLPTFAPWYFGRPLSPLPLNEVLYAGQAVAAVGATDTNGVEEAADLVQVNYEPLPYVKDAEEAIASDAPQLWPGGNVTGPNPFTIAYGDVNAGLHQADEVVENVRLDTQIEQHYEMEPRACVCSWQNGQLIVWASNEYVHGDYYGLSSYFGIPLNNVVVKTALGGYEGGAVMGMALGNKSGGIELAIASVMARKVGVPVKYGPTRSDNALITTCRFPVRGYVTLGGTKDGTMTAMKVNLYINSGAYGGFLATDTVSDFVNAYSCPNMEVNAVTANTNAYSLGAFMRDVGESQGHFIMESAVDMLAEKLGVEPSEFRLKNMRTSANAIDPTVGLPYTGTGMPAAFLNATQAFNWASRWKGWGVAESVNGPLRRGIGLAVMNAQKGGPSPPCSGQIQVDPDGTVTAFTGLTDHGAGGNTTFAIFAAESLGLTSLANIRMVQSDTSMNSDASCTNGSQSTYNCGLAFLAAAEDLKRQWFPIVAASLGNGASPDQMTFGNDMIYVQNNPSLGMSFTDAAALLSAPIKGVGVVNIPSNVSFRTSGVKIAEVEVDVETADVRVTDYASGLDIGRVIFHKGAESQIRGGAMMGIGETLYQDTWYDPTTGKAMNPNFHDFRVPTIMETPDNITVTWEEYVDPVGPWGAKGIGEPSLISVSPAIANALSNALGGYRFTKLPITRQDIVAAIEWMTRNGKL